MKLEPMSFDQAAKLLGLHRRTATGRRRYPGGRKIRASEEEAVSAGLQAIGMMRRAEALRAQKGEKLLD